MSLGMQYDFEFPLDSGGHVGAFEHNGDIVVHIRESDVGPEVEARFTPEEALAFTERLDLLALALLV